MVDRNDVMPLLDSIADDADLSHRLLLLDALSAMPLTPQAWRELGPMASSLLKRLAITGGLDDAARAVLARIPLRSVRERLRRIAANPKRADALPMALALAAAHDAAGLPTLRAALSDAPCESVAQAIASLPLEDLAVAAADLEPGLAAADEMTRCWTAIAMARVSHYEPLEQVWDALVRPPAFFETHPRRRLLTAPPPIFHGDPSRTLTALRGLGPQPQTLQAFVQGLMRNDFDAGVPRDPTFVQDARDAELFVEGLVAQPAQPKRSPPPSDPRAAAKAGQAARRLVSTPWRGLDPAWQDGEREWLHATPPELAAEVVESALRGLVAPQKLPDLDRAPPWALGNALLNLVTALPEALPLRIASLVRVADELPHIPRDALAWTAARAGAPAVLAALTPDILSTEADERGRWLAWLRDIALELEAPAPFAGAGGGVASTGALHELIDDVSWRDAMPSQRGAPPASFATVAPGAAPDPVHAPPASARRELFPDIATPDLHPIAGQNVIVDISLAEQAAPGMVGSVHLPDSDPQTIHILQVHLLFGEQSAWSELRYAQALGTVARARFTLPAPATTEPNTLCTLRANFYLNQRWCGEGLRNLDVRRDAQVDPLADIPMPTLPDWHQGLTLEPGAAPPDLIVRIQKSGGIGEYRWSCLSPHLNLATPTEPAEDRMALGSDAETFVRNLFKPLADKPLDEMDIVDVEGAGDVIYNATPSVFKQAYWAVWLAAKQGGFAFDSIQLITDEPYVPWELMRVADDQHAPDDPPELLSIRHCVGRWLASQSSGLTQRIPVQSVAVSASDYSQVDGVAQKLPWASKERELLMQHYHAIDVPLQSTPLLAFLLNGRAQAVHFACHGKMSIAAPDTSFLVLEDTPHVLKPPAIGRTEVRRGLGRQRPLIFLNACEVGGAAASLSIVAGFPAAFLSAGAAAVVCPLWAVNDERAMRIAETFYASVLVADGKPLGQVLREVRAAWRTEGHLTYLAYVLYGDPLARVDYSGTT